MRRETVKGNKQLAKELGVSRDTVQEWRKRGILAPAVLADIGRIIIYDMEKVYECLHNRKVTRGRPRMM